MVIDGVVTLQGIKTVGNTNCSSCWWFDGSTAARQTTENRFVSFTAYVANTGSKPKSPRQTAWVERADGGRS
jgi:hypothetical protein